MPGERWCAPTGKWRGSRVCRWARTPNANTQGQKHSTQRCSKHTCCSNQRTQWYMRIKAESYLKDIWEQHYVHMHTQVCSNHRRMQRHIHTHTHACGNRRRISEATQIPQMCRMTGADEEEGIGRRSSVPGRRGGGEGVGGLMEGGGVAGRAGCLLLFKRQWVLCAD